MLRRKIQIMFRNFSSFKLTQYFTRKINILMKTKNFNYQTHKGKPLVVQQKMGECLEKQRKLFGKL